VWSAQPFENQDGQGVTLDYTSADGEEGYPGTLRARVTYTLTPYDRLIVDYQATTDKPTPVNLSQHTYWNLVGNASRNILGHFLTINADAITPVDSTLIPTGEITPVTGTPFDFRTPTAIGTRIDQRQNTQLRFGNGYDHNFVLNRGGVTADALVFAARVVEPTTGRTLEIYTTEPGVQFYSGNFLDGTITGKGGSVYKFRYGLALETQHYPDSPNHPNFPSTILRPGHPFRSRTEFKFGVDTPPTASSPAAKNGQARIVGVVVDSLNGGFLSGADVFVQGRRITAETDSLGKFELDSLPPGGFQLGLNHPLLEALGLPIFSRPFYVGPDSTSIVVLSVPSAATIVHMTCSTSGGPDQSAVIGEVKDPESLQPVVGAEVSVDWIEIEVSKQTGFRETPYLKRDTTDKSGRFKLCGLPRSLRATLKAQHGAAVTAEVPIALGDRPIELSARTLLLSAIDSTTTTGNATVSGVVLLADGAPKTGTRVELVGTESVAVTDARGEFTMRSLPSGTRMLLARHLGYSPQSVPIALSSHVPQQVTITLPKYLTVMDPVLVVARRNAALDKVGFGHRRRTEAFGYFIGPERLQGMHPSSITNLLQIVPGLRVIQTQTGQAISSKRDIGPSCVDYYLDDVRYTEASSIVPGLAMDKKSPTRSTGPTGDINNFVNPDEIVAVEVYQAGEAPAQYTRPFAGCLTILLWTRFKAGN